MMSTDEYSQSTYFYTDTFETPYIHKAFKKPAKFGRICCACVSMYVYIIENIIVLLQ